MNIKHPLVSVIIPVYNHASYVTEAIYSVFNQSYPHIELIIIDDGSNDNCCSVIDSVLASWKTPDHITRNITFIKQQVNQGAHATINRGLSLAQGEWLTILNSDDYYHIERIQTLVQKTTKAKAEIAFTYVVAVDAENKTLPPDHSWWRWYERARYELFLKSPTVGFKLLDDNLAISTGNLFFSKKLFQEIGPFKNLKLVHDKDFILRALVISEPLLVRNYLYYYRLHGENTVFKVAHLFESELNEVNRQYLMSVSAQPPKNKQAPCHWYWPLEFAKWRDRLKMDKGLGVYIQAPTNKKTSIAGLDSLLKKYLPGEPITIISHDLSLSGIPKLVADLALCLSKHGYSPRIISLADGPMRQELEKYGYYVHVISNKSKLLSFLSLFYAIFFRVRGRVIANSIMSWTMVLPLAIFRPWSRPIWYIHESYTPIAIFKGLRGKIVNQAIKLSKKLVPPQLWFGSESTRQAWKYSHLSEGKVLYWSGISKQENSTKQSSREPLKKLLTVGTASARKGTHTLIEAFLTCLKEKRIPKDTTLTIVGFPDSNNKEFPSLGDSILKIITSQYEKNIHLVGSAHPYDLDQYFEDADVFVQCSTLECLPIALLTAMSIGLPIITTNVDGCNEAIIDNQTGLVCFPYDIDSLCESIERAVNNPELSYELGKNAQETFNNSFSLEATQGALLNALK